MKTSRESVEFKIARLLARAGRVGNFENVALDVIDALVDELCHHQKKIDEAEAFGFGRGFNCAWNAKDEAQFEGYCAGFSQGFDLGFSNRSHLAALQHLEASDEWEWLGDNA